ncbi:hypothetical protein JL720_6436 [Aureococcus anophagefferens]|nr:hypothetical protein JL720_6436 [Aureococcus anophagefferens]
MGKRRPARPSPLRLVAALLLYWDGDGDGDVDASDLMDWDGDGTIDALGSLRWASGLRRRGRRVRELLVFACSPRVAALPNALFEATEVSKSCDAAIYARGDVTADVLRLARAVRGEGVPYVVAWATSAHDEAARLFSRAFFEALVASRASRGAKRRRPSTLAKLGRRLLDLARPEASAARDAYAQAYQEAVDAIAFETRLGTLANGVRSHVPRFELRDPHGAASLAYAAPAGLVGEAYRSLLRLLTPGGGKKDDDLPYADPPVTPR